MTYILIKKCIAALVALSLSVSSFANIPVSQFTYDTASRLAAVQTASGTTGYGYNMFGELVQEKWPDTPGALTYGQGPQGLTGVFDPRGLSTSYARTGHGDLVQQVSPDTGTDSFTHDEAGNVLTRTTATGAVLTYQYDLLDRVKSVTSPEGTILFSYDGGLNGKGRLYLVQDPSGTTSMNYDVHGNVTSRTHAIVGGASLGVNTAYSNGKVSQITYPSGRVVSFSYDAERVTAISVNGVQVLSNVQYFPFGPPTSWQRGPGGSLGTYSRAYDTAGRITSYTHESSQRAVTWDASSRIAAQQGVDSRTYGYDGLDRLTSANEAALGTRDFALDLVGNRTSVGVNGSSFSYGVDAASNRLTSSAAPGVSRSYQYDAAGHTLTDGTRTYTWNSFGELATATNSATVAQYTYNGFGQRVKKVVGTKTRYFVYADDGVSLLGEYWQVGAGTPVGVINEVIYLEGIPVLVLKGGQVYYVQPDHQNAPRLIRDGAGTVVWRWDSDAFGNGAANQNPGGVSLFEFNLRFPGQQFDAETGLHYNNARYYDPAIGRYISSDPIGLAGGLNTFSYVSAKPTVNVDPMGLSERDIQALLNFGRITADRMIKEGNKVDPVWGLGSARFASSLGNIFVNVSGRSGKGVSLMNCMDQSQELYVRLRLQLDKQTLFLDDKWRFDYVGVRDPNRPRDRSNLHRWVRGVSNNEKDDIVVLDTWLSLYDRVPRAQWSQYMTEKAGQWRGSPYTQ